MKNIELTDAHKSKLLEMCEKLFITYKYHSIWNNDIVLGVVKRKTPFCESDKFLEGLTSIHWFEFCMTHLVIKLNISKEDYLELSLKCNHKVDYLYEKFKKLK